MRRLRVVMAGFLGLVAAVGSALAQEPAAGAPAAEAPAVPELQVQEPDVVTMGTGNIAGVYFPVGVALCRLANQHRRETNLRCAARPTAGSVANIAALRDGSLDLAIVQSDIQADALNGVGPFAEAGPYADLRSVMALYPELLTVVVRADGGVQRIEDLAGKRVVLGEPGSGTRALADALMQALGWTTASFAATPDIAPDRVGNALCGGEIDAFLYAVGHPSSLIQAVATDCDVTLVDAAGPAVDELVRETPSFVAATIPAGLYRGTPRSVATFGVSATLVTRAAVPQDSIYAIVSGIFGDFDMLRGLDPVLVGLDPEAMVADGLSAPLHPGAERYYREQGWLR